MPLIMIYSARDRDCSYNSMAFLSVFIRCCYVSLLILTIQWKGTDIYSYRLVAIDVWSTQLCTCITVQDLATHFRATVAGGY